MSKTTGIITFMRSCPELSNLWAFATTEELGTSVIISRGSSDIFRMENELIDVCGNYSGDVVPYESIYEDFQILCYKPLDPNDNSSPRNNINVLSFEEVENVCDWVREQNRNNNFPIIGEKVISIESLSTLPLNWGVNLTEGIIAYSITIRIRYVNPEQRKSIEYELED